MGTVLRNQANPPRNTVLPVSVLGTDPAVRHIPEIAACAQTRYDFRLSRAVNSLTLQITDGHEHSLFSLDANGVAVSAWQSEGIARYAGIDRATYFLLCGALGLLQQRALALNPMLQPDDFLYNSGSDCLFSLRPVKQEYALLIEHPRICAGCVQFFDCLGCEPEVGALLDILGFIRNNRLRPTADN